MTGVKKIKDGNLEYKFELKGKDEFTEVTNMFNQMTERLRNIIIELADKRKLEELNRLKSEFISNISHELRTPLTYIKGSADNLLDVVPGKLNEKQKKHIRMILDSCSQIIPMIDNLLDMSRLESGKIILQCESLNLKVVVDDVILRLKVFADTKNINIENKITQNTPCVFADHERLSEILFNLLHNAVKFTPEKGSITIDACKSRIDDFRCQAAGSRRVNRDGGQTEELFDYVLSSHDIGYANQGNAFLGLDKYAAAKYAFACFDSIPEGTNQKELIDSQRRQEKRDEYNCCADICLQISGGFGKSA